MHKIDFKTLKVLALSIISLICYLFLENSEKVNERLLRFKSNNSINEFGFYVVINLLKWFLFIFGIIALTMLIVKVYKRKRKL
ncbi:hypothetical protein [Polaribacter sp.]|uniref:hypothetical protein n=1 Tax=Polaribacter sp. TaxID=1920175 RepID=UPI003F6AFDF5